MKVSIYLIINIQLIMLPENQKKYHENRIFMAIIAVSFIGTYFINVLRHKADKPYKFGFVVVMDRQLMHQILL